MAYETNKDANYNNLRGVNEKVSEYITSEEQFLDLRNYGFTRPGALVSRPGVSDFASLPLATYLATPQGFFEYIRNSGASTLVFDCGPTLFALGPTALGGSLTANVTTALAIDFEISNNYLYYANGYSYQRYNGSFCVFYGIPSQLGGDLTHGATFDISILGSSATLFINPGSYTFRFSYVKGGWFGFAGDTAGAEGPIGQRAADDLISLNPIDYIAVVGSTLTYTTGGWRFYGFTVPPGYGISTILPWIKRPGESTFTAGPNLAGFNLQDFGGSTLYQAEFERFNNSVNVSEQFPFTLVPKYLETYNNMLFMAGFSSVPSTVWYSELSGPENIEEENFFEVRTSNGDQITNMIPFQSNLIIFKNRSTHELTGASPESLSLKDVNLEYGCVNSTAAVTFNNKLWFLDSRGICEYNGPNTFVVSYPVETILNTLDKSLCRAFYIKKRSEVWWCFGSVCLIYDHNVEGWTIYDRLAIKATAGAAVINHGASTVDLAFIERGSSFIQFTSFEDALTTDRGQAITLIAKTRFHTRGESTQEMWRRLYLNADPVANVNVTIGLFSDYSAGASHYISTTLAGFQSRVEFGVSAKSLSLEIVLKSSSQIVINGYTLESRYLRSV